MLISEFFFSNICHRLNGEYIEMQKTLNEMGANVQIAICDASENSDLADKYDVVKFPHYKWFK